MKLQNISLRTYMHDDVILKAGDVADVPQNIADIWLQSDDIIKYADPVDLEKLQKENDALKAKVQKMQEPLNVKPVMKKVNK